MLFLWSLKILTTKLVFFLQNSTFLSTKDKMIQQLSEQALTPKAALQYLFPANPDASRLTLLCRRGDYAASVIARAVEDADAHLLNLNVTGQPSVDDRVTVEVRISHRNAGAVARSLERYGIEVIAVDNADGPDIDTARRRVNELIHYLDV